MELTANTRIVNYDVFTTSATTHENQHPPLNLHLLTQEELREKEIQRKKECKLRNKLKRTNLFTKKGTYGM